MPPIIRFHETGGADVLKIEDLPLAEPGEGEVRLKVQAISLNRGEQHYRAGRDPDYKGHRGRGYCHYARH